MIKKGKERKGVGGDTKDTSNQVRQITMATKECGLKFMSPLFQQRGSKWTPSGLTESMHLSECCGLLLENALGIEKEETHSHFVSPSLPSPSQAKTLVSEGTTLSFPESVQTKPRRILALSHSPEKCWEVLRRAAMCLTVLSQRTRVPGISSEHFYVLS